MENEELRDWVVQLDQFLKIQGVTQSGGEAKHLIQGGNVKVNSVVDVRRKRKLRAGDVVEIGDKRFVVEENV